MLEPAPGHRPMRRRVEDARRWAATTPGRLRMFSLEVAVGALLLMAIGSGTQIAALLTVAGIQQRTVPAIVGMRHVHAWLSDADRSATSAYLAGGFDSSVTQLQFEAESAATDLDLLGRMSPDDPQLRYEADIAAASRELQRATAQTPDADPSDQRLQAIAVAIANYTRLMDTASAEERTDVAAGTVYLEAGSNLMHGPGGILAQVDDMDRRYAADLAGANFALQVTSRVMVLYLAVAVALLVLLLRTQFYVRARFRRRRNKRLATATLLLLLLSLGAGAGTVRAAQVVGAGEERSYPQLLDLWQARAFAYDANAGETLALVEHGRTAQSDRAFHGATAQLVDRPLTDQLVIDAEHGQVRFNGLLADELRTADSAPEQEAAQHALVAYRQFVQADQDMWAQADAAAQAAQAAQLARAQKPARPVVPAPPIVVTDRALVAAADELDWYLGAAMQARQSQLDAALSSAQLMLEATAAAEVLAVAIAALTFWGLQPRIDEYAV